MAGFLKRLLGNERGNALILAGAGMPMLMGFAGLANDTIQWSLWKRQLQRQADSAALAGAYARISSQDVNSVVTRDLTKNSRTGIAFEAGYPSVQQPTIAGVTHAVQVTLAVKKALPFSSFFLANAPTLVARSTAAARDDGVFCAVGLKKGNTSSITIGGTAIVNLGCPIISNGESSTASVNPNGASCNLTSPLVAGVGGMPSSVCGASNTRSYYTPLPDPFENLYSTSVPSGMTCRNFNQQTYTRSDGTTGLRAGCFNGFNAQNATYHLDPGVYYLNSAGISLSGQQRLVGTGVTLIFTGTNPGSFSMNGGSSAHLTAPTTGAYATMLMIQSSNATEGNDNNINGDNNSSFDGAIYFPKGDMQFNGSSAAGTKCAMVVALTLDFSGNTNLQNNLTGCTANRTVAGKSIRLVA